MRATHRGTLALIAAAAALTLATALPARAQATAEGRPTVAMDGKWHFTVAPYFWCSGIKGNVSVKGLPAVPVEVPFSDAIKNFHSSTSPTAGRASWGAYSW